MKALQKLIERIAQRIDIHLRELRFEAGPCLRQWMPLGQLLQFYGIYGFSPNHPPDLSVSRSNLAGSCLLGKCSVDHAVLYKSDIRGDELKKRGDLFRCHDRTLPVYEDEKIRIKDSLLIKTLVHHCSHDLENPEEFTIQNSAAAHYANIHGSPMEGCFLEPFATVDLTTMHDAAVGAFSYIQAGETGKQRIDPGTIWIRSAGRFNFLYRFARSGLEPYIRCREGKKPEGLLLDFVNAHKAAFQPLFDVVTLDTALSVPPTASLDRHAVVRPKIQIADNVLVAQRAYLENSCLGKGANAQENCYIINSRLAGLNVTAHGAKIVGAALGARVFVGFNAFLRGSPPAPLTIGAGCIVMPHTIIDLQEGLEIAPEHLVWGLIRNRGDLQTHCLPLATFAGIRDGLRLGELHFEGDGGAFINAFNHRIEHILEANGAFFDGVSRRGHAQKNQNMAFNIVQPYPEGDLEGIYPTIEIRP